MDLWSSDTYPLGRLGKHADMASTFARWQGMISDPNLTRKLASQVIIFEFGMVITGEDEGPFSARGSSHDSTVTLITFQ